VTDASRPVTGALEAVEEAVLTAGHAIIHTAEIAFRLPEPSASRWHRAGVGARAERVFDVVAGLVLALFASGWAWSIAMARAAADGDISRATASIAAALTDPNAPSTAYLTNAMLEALVPLRGESGKLRVSFQQPGQPVLPDTLAGAVDSAAVRVATAPTDTGSTVTPEKAGIWSLAVKVGSALKPVTDFNIVTLRPFAEKQRGRIGLYYIGSWPGERRRSTRPGYGNPSGFIEVTPQNQDTHVSEHFRLRDFVTKGQENVWPKYLVLDIKLVDKLELVLSELAAMGHDVSRVTVMSGFRTPSYNSRGGNTAGRAELSRHMYGDAADIFIDRDGNGTMDDLNGDRRVNIADARVILAAVDRVERDHPELLGGTGVYVASSGHGPFIHIDTRGFRARWVGTGDD